MKLTRANARLSAPRNNGLDTLRAAAISLVFMYHYMVFVSHEPTFGWASVVGWVGVDLFFVLSGYLISNQIFAGIARGQRLSPKAFYARRALRTLPVFWLVLAIYFTFPTAMGGRTPPPLWTFLSFTQNLSLQPGTAFSHAWSLCVEEQFYLLLPLAIVIGARCGQSRRQGWRLLIALTVLGISARSILWLRFGTETTGEIDKYYPNIYYSSLCRFDEFIPGIAVAMLKNFHPEHWKRLMHYGQQLLICGALATASMLFCVYRYYYIDDYGYGYLMTGPGYSLIAAAFAVLVIAALSPHSWLSRIRVPGAYHLALWSYSTYLSHKPLAYILIRVLKPLELSNAATLYIIATACIGMGWLLYRLIEAPFMLLRDRLVPNTFHGAPAPQPID